MSRCRSESHLLTFTTVMPSAKGSQSSSAPKQTQLRFSARRAASTASGKSKGKAPTRASSSDAALGHSEPSPEEKVPTKKRKLEGEQEEKCQKKAKRVFNPREGEENSQQDDHATGAGLEPVVPRAPAKLRLNDARWSKPYAAAKEKLGYMKPIHAEGQNKVHLILRTFDLSYEYGPCVGVTRLERWERADALGLNPPPEIKDILTTKDGLEEDKYKQCVFYEFEV